MPTIPSPHTAASAQSTGCMIRSNDWVNDTASTISAMGQKIA